jgi:hypothetical protein
MDSNFSVSFIVFTKNYLNEFYNSLNINISVKHVETETTGQDRRPEDIGLARAGKGNGLANTYPRVIHGAAGPEKDVFNDIGGRVNAVQANREMAGRGK